MGKYNGNASFMQREESSGADWKRCTFLQQSRSSQLCGKTDEGNRFSNGTGDESVSR